MYFKISKLLFLSLVFLSLSAFSLPEASAQEGEADALLVSQAVDQICSQLEKGEKPDRIFSISVNHPALNEARAKWLNPREWVPGANKEEMARYIGSLAFVRLKAPFFRVAQAVTAYDSEAKFIPGIVSSKVLERVRESVETEIVLLERERELPLGLKALVVRDGHYKIENRIRRKENSWLLVRIRLVANDQKPEKGVMKVIEGFEYVGNLGQDQVLYMSGGFGLPNTGFIRVAKNNKPAKPPPKPLGAITFGFLDKVTSRLDVGNQIYRLVTESILEGAYQDVAAVTLLTTDPKWRDKWAYQLTAKDTGKILQKNKSLLRKAKKNRWILYSP